MDDLTRERYPHGIPWREQRARPAPFVRAPVDVGSRRIALCGTDDLNVLEAGGDMVVAAAIARDRRLVEAIRGWAA